MELIEPENIASKIFTIRGLQVMLDTDLAQLYHTETKYINRALKRNPIRFPEHFAFQLTKEEYENLRFLSDTSSGNHGGRRNMCQFFEIQPVNEFAVEPFPWEINHKINSPNVVR